MSIKSFTSCTYNTSIWQLLESFKNSWIIPEFQRGYVWTDDQVSRLIQSIALGLPVASIIVCPVETSVSTGPYGNNYLIDGLQRCSAIDKFVNQGFNLTNVCIPELAGKTIKDIDFHLHFLQVGVTCVNKKMTEKEAKDFFILINESTTKMDEQHLESIKHK